MIKVLNIVMNLRVSSGVSSYAMNYFNKIDKTKFQIDFLELAAEKSPNDDVVKQFGGNIYYLPNKRNLKEYISSIKDFFRKNQYDIIHVHVVGPSAAIILREAKKQQVSVRIYHSHMIGIVESKIAQIKTWIATKLCVYYSTHCFACSFDAGKSVFRKHKFEVVMNGIDVDKFLFSNTVRNSKRTELNLEGKIVLGTVCRTVPEKNPYFMLDIIKECVKISRDVVFIWAGSGLLDTELREYVEKTGIRNHVRFLGSRSDVNELYQVMDAFLMPSVYEGLGIVYIEAQIAGLPTFASEGVSKTTNISPNIHYLSTKADPSIWAKQIMLSVQRNNELIRMDESHKKNAEDNGFSIEKCANNLEKLYIDAVSEKRGLS